MSGQAGTPRPQALRALPPTPSTFTTAVLPCFQDVHRILPDEDGQQPFSGRELALHIQCPEHAVDGYLDLLCREATLLRARMPQPPPVASLWLHGHPSRQFSPEAITELIFRLNGQFPGSVATAVRGLELPATAVDGERLALLAGLGFNRIALRLDATLGSDVGHLTKLEALQRELADFPALGVHYLVRFGSRCHPHYLSRLLAAIRQPPAVAVELQDPDLATPRPLIERVATGRRLKLAILEMTAAGWVGLSNQLFVPTDSPLALNKSDGRLHLTPWGPQLRDKYLALGMGVGAFGYHPPCYYRTTTLAARYGGALGNRQLPEKLRYRLRDDLGEVHQSIQALLCRHSLPRRSAPEYCDSLAAIGLMSIDRDVAHLTRDGVVRLSAIIHHLQSVSSWRHHYAQRRLDDRHGV